MTARLLCLPTPVAAGAVFRALADIEAFPVWAAAYCERLELSLGRWRALTVAGDLFIELEADARTGVVDLRLGDSGGCARYLPLRVLALPGGGTLVSAVLLPGAERAVWGAFESGLLEESLRGLLRSLEQAESPAEAPEFVG